MSRVMTVRLSVLLLALWGTGIASAQEPAPVSEQAPAPTLSPPPLVPAPPGDAVSPPFHPEPPVRLLPPPESIGHRVGRVSLEVLGGALGSAVGFGVGFYGGTLLSQQVSCGLDCNEGAYLTLGVVGVGMALSASAGVLGGGALLDGEGRFLHTLGGAVLAEGAVLGLMALGLESNEALLSFFVAPLVGALVGYEVSHAWKRQEPSLACARREAAPELHVTPIINVTSEGGALGLAGRF